MRSKTAKVSLTTATWSCLQPLTITQRLGSPYCPYCHISLIRYQEIKKKRFQNQGQNIPTKQEVTPRGTGIWQLQAQALEARQPNASPSRGRGRAPQPPGPRLAAAPVLPGPPALCTCQPKLAGRDGQAGPGAHTRGVRPAGEGRPGRATGGRGRGAGRRASPYRAQIRQQPPADQ